MEEEEKRGWKRMKGGYYLVVQYDGLAATGLERKQVSGMNSTSNYTGSMSLLLFQEYKE